MGGFEVLSSVKDDESVIYVSAVALDEGQPTADAI